MLQAGSCQPPRKKKCAGKEAAHALETLVETRVRVAVRVCPNPNVPVDGRLPGGNDDTQGSDGVTSIVRALGLVPACYD